MRILIRIAVILIFGHYDVYGEKTISPILNTEVDTARCRSSCVLNNIRKQSINLENGCRSGEQSVDDASEDTDQDTVCLEDTKCPSDEECSTCWDICQKLSNANSQIWFNTCNEDTNPKCGVGCKTACDVFKNKSRQSNRHLTKSLRGSFSKKSRNDDQDENRIPRPKQRRVQRVRNRKNNRRGQRIRHKDIRLDAPKMLEDCRGMSWTDPTKNIHFATPLRKEQRKNNNRGSFYQRRQDHLHALIYILFARNNFNEWFEIAQTTNFSYSFKFPKRNLYALNEIRLLAVSNHGIIDQITLNITSLDCDIEKSPMSPLPLISNSTQTLERFRRTFRNDEIDNFVNLILNPPDQLFLPLVIACLIIALACIFMLALLVTKALFRSMEQTRAEIYLNEEIATRDSCLGKAGDNLNARHQIIYEDPILAEKDFTIFTIYEPNSNSTSHLNGLADKSHHIKHTQL